ALGATGLSAAGSNERVRLGFIGVGNRGDQLLDAFLVHPDAEVVALCDVYQPYLEPARKKANAKAQLYTDFRKLLEQKDVDAVVTRPPAHRPALQFLAACGAGKDVYAENPPSLPTAGGRKMAAVAPQTKRVTQVGLHRRSSAFIREAVEAIRGGAIGK